VKGLPQLLPARRVHPAVVRHRQVVRVRPVHHRHRVQAARLPAAAVHHRQALRVPHHQAVAVVRPVLRLPVRVRLLRPALPVHPRHRPQALLLRVVVAVRPHQARLLRQNPVLRHPVVAAVRVRVPHLSVHHRPVQAPHRRVVAAHQARLPVRPHRVVVQAVRVHRVRQNLRPAVVRHQVQNLRVHLHHRHLLNLRVLRVRQAVRVHHHLRYRLL